jgi:pentatricopeptide repeat protein
MKIFVVGRLLKGDNGRRNIELSSARKFRQFVQGGNGNLHVQIATTLSEAIALLKNQLQQGITVDSYMYIKVLKQCSKQKDPTAAKHVHDCIIKSGMEQNFYVVNNLLSTYINCGRLQDANQAFVELAKKDVSSWNIMIGGYARQNRTKDAMEVFNKMIQEGVKPNEITYLSILKACANPSGLKWGKEVHSHISHGGLESDVCVGTALLKMYAKCGCIKEARQVFDRLTSIDVISWNVMIGAYAESGRGVEAFDLFLQMKRDGFKPDAITYISILNACAREGAIEWVKKVHSHILEAGLESDLRVANALVHMYAKSGSIDDARRVFDRMKERNVITWNIMIGGLAQDGCGRDAYELFLQMNQEGFKPDATTYVSILNPCASAGALEWVKDVHILVVEAGLESDLRVGNALVHMFAKSGSIDDAKLAFDSMKDRNVITWNIIIGGLAQAGCGHEAYKLFLRMQREGCVPDSATYVNILNPCSSTGALEWVKEIHSHAMKAGCGSDLRVGNALVHMYIKSGSLKDARLVFNSMKERDIITWNIMIGGLAQDGCGHEAYDLFLRLQREGCVPDATTYVSVLNPCASEGALEWVKEIHSHIVEAGLESDLRVGNALVHMYAKSGSIDDARLIFDGMKKRDVITWNIMIGGLAQDGCGREAYELFLQMRKESFKPDAITYVSILNACASAGALEWVKEVHRHVVEAGLQADLHVGNALVDVYVKVGSIDDARRVFNRMEERDVITWTILIGGLAQHGCGCEALEVFREMNTKGVNPDEYSFVAVLSACSYAGLLDEGRQLFLAMMRDFGVKPTLAHYNCMVDLLGRAGQLEEAKLLIANMPLEPNGATWGSLLGACRSHGNVELGELAAEECIKLEPKDASPYVLLSNIYAAAGKWKEVSLVRSVMQERAIHKEPGRSWIEVDNKIHEFVSGDTSHPEAKDIYAELKRLTECLQVEGYIPDIRLVLHNIDEEDKKLALCSHSERLAISYGLLHTPYPKPIRVYKNLRVCSDCHTATKFLSKITRREIVARDANRFHHFKDGVCSCGDYW